MKKIYSVLGVIVMALLVTACTTVDANQTALKVTRGVVTSCIGPGWDGPHPFSFGYKVAKFSMGLQHTDMLKSAKEGDLKESDAVRINAKGGAGFGQDVTINYRITSSCETLKQLYAAGVKSDNDVKTVIVRPAVRSAARDIAGAYTVTEFISTKRQEVAEKLRKELDKKMALPPGRGAVQIESVELRNSDLPPNIQAQVDATTQQEAEAQKAEINRRQKETEAQTNLLIAQKANEQAVAQAKAAAETARINAEAAANAAVTAGKAKAEANRVEAASLTPELIDLQKAIAQAEALSKAGTVIVGGSGSSGGSTNLVITPSSK